MQDLASALNTVKNALKGIGDVWNALPPFMKMNFFELIGTLASGAQIGGGQAALNKLLINPPKPGGISYNKNGSINRDGNPATPFAKGGIVTGPTLGLVGEAGPEAIIPLNRFDEVIGGRGGNITINVTAGMGTDGAAVGEQIVNAIRRYERTSGAVFAKV